MTCAPLTVVRYGSKWRNPSAAAFSRGARTVAKILAQGEPIYGVNTGFGKLAQTRIADEDLTDLQLNLLRSHAAGTGAPLPPAVVRLILLLKIKSLSRGHSGIRTENT